GSEMERWRGQRQVGTEVQALYRLRPPFPHSRASLQLRRDGDAGVVSDEAAPADAVSHRLGPRKETDFPLARESPHPLAQAADASTLLNDGTVCTKCDTHPGEPPFPEMTARLMPGAKSATGSGIRCHFAGRAGDSGLRSAIRVPQPNRSPCSGASRRER